MKKFKWGLSGAIGAATAASACCTIPLALVSAGIGGAWVSNLVALEPFRPLFMGLSIGLLGFAFYQGKKPISDQACDCDDEMNPRTKNILLSVGIVVAVALMASPKFLPKTNSNMSATDMPVQGGVSYQEATLVVQDMTCETCTTTVHTALSQLDGVFEVLVTYEPPHALVRFDANRVGIVDFELATRNAGYPASLINSENGNAND